MSAHAAAPTPTPVAEGERATDDAVSGGVA